jgi:hypothetical protein
MFVLTVDQRRSRRGPDRVDAALARLDGLVSAGLARPPARGFERTAGDEFQGLFDDAASVVTLALDLVRDGGWHVGVGAGGVETPLPTLTRAGRGPAFSLARDAVETAKRTPDHVCVRGADAGAAEQADAVLALLAAVVARRSEPAWEALDLLSEGRTTGEVAAKLGVTRQAVSQRLAAGLWQQERAARPVAARLLVEAAG